MKVPTEELVEKELGAGMVQEFGAEVFRTLCMLTRNEANQVVRGSVRDGRRNGFLALKLMCNRFNPRTPARLFKLLIDIFKPGTIKDVRDVARGIEEWEGRVSKLRNEFGENFSESMLVAIMISFLPKELQDMVFQMGSAGEELRYVEIRDKVVGVAGHRSLGFQPRPAAELNSVPWDTEGSEEDWEKEERELDALGKGWPGVKCHRCGGVGHMARECGTPAGKGIENMGKGGKAWGGQGMKGSPKGGSKGGYGKGPFGEKGKGEWGRGPQGYKGECWKCGKTGHKQWECRGGGKGVHEVGADGGEAEKDACAIELGGVWSVCEVSRLPQKIVREDESWIKVESRRKKRTWKKFEDMEQKPSAEDDDKLSGPEIFIGAVPVGEVMEMKFQVCDVRKPLAAVWKICKNQNIVQFGPRDEDNFIMNIRTGKKIWMKKKSGSYVIEVDFVDDKFEKCGSGEITIDSAAEESVCPRVWADCFPADEVKKGEEMKLVNASGGKIEHYGSKRVWFKMPF